MAKRRGKTATVGRKSKRGRFSVDNDEGENITNSITPNQKGKKTNSKGGRKTRPDDYSDEDDNEDEDGVDDGPEVEVDVDDERAMTMMKEQVKALKGTIEKMEARNELISTKKYVQGKRRWGKRNLLSTDAGSQQMINNFVKKYLFKQVKFLPFGFEKWSEGTKTICGMMMKMINVPSNRKKKEYWTNDIVPALVYKVQMAKNQRLQKMKVVFNRMYYQ